MIEFPTLLRICIRALDYIPPVGITFGEYLRALITADVDLAEDDPLGIDNKKREADTIDFFKKNLENPLTALLLDSQRHDRFAILHALANLGN